MIDCRRGRSIERLALRAWPSVETVEYDGWVLRASDGYTKRANSVNPHFGSSLPLEEKLSHCEDFYAERQLPPIFRLTPFSVPGQLDERLEARGYQTLDPTVVMTGPVQLQKRLETIDVQSPKADEWHTAFETLRNLPAEKRTPHRWIVDHAEGERCFALVESEDRPIACGLGILVEETLGLFDLLTAPEHRRAGHATTLLGHIFRWASKRGATGAFLQVQSENPAARRLYERLGFEVAYPYWYRIGGS